MQELNFRSLLVSAKGGVLDFIGDDGEVLMSVAVPPGIHSARPYLEVAPEGATVELSEGLTAREPRAGYGVQIADGRADSGANPDYQPTSADRMQWQMRMQMSQLQAQQNAFMAKLTALAKVDLIPDAPKGKAEAEGEEAPVVE